MRLFFLIALSLNISSQGLASPFSEKHIDPFLIRLSDKTTQVLLAAGTLSVLAVNPQDEEIRSNWKQHQKMPESQSAVGDILGTGGPGLVIAASQYYFDSNENHYQSHLRALANTTLATYTLKYSFGRSRPGGSRSRQSFPSGHTATAFATATALTYAYGFPAAAVAYPVAAFVGLSRLAVDAHWGSDIVGGAFLGFIIGRASSYEFREPSGLMTNIFIFPVAALDFQGVGLALSFQ